MQGSLNAVGTEIVNFVAQKFRTRDSRALRATLLATVAIICLASFLLYGTVTAGCLIASTCLGYLLTSFFCFQPEGLKWRIALENMAVRTFPFYLKPTDLAPETAVASVKCHKEAQKIIKLVMRDFVTSWYDHLSTDRAFPEDVQRVLEHIALEVNLRVQAVDLNKMVSELVAIVVPYIQVLNEVGINRDRESSTLHDRCVRLFENNPSVAHKALRTPDAEARHYRHLVDVAIQCCLPGEYRACSVATMFIREVLFHKVLRSLVDLLCDPDFLMAAIPLVLDKAPPDRIQDDLDTMAKENRELDAPVDPGSVSVTNHLSLQRPSPVRSRAIGRSASARVGSGGLQRGGSLETRMNEGGDHMRRDKGGRDLSGREGRRWSVGKEDQGSSAGGMGCELNSEEDHLSHGSKEDHLSRGSKEDHLSRGSKEDHLSRGSKEDHLSHGSKEDHLSHGSKEDQSSKGRWWLRLPKTHRLKGRKWSGGVKRAKDPKGPGGKEEEDEAVAEEGEEEHEEEDFDDGIDLAPIYIIDHMYCKDSDGDYVGYIVRFPKELLTASIQLDLNLLDCETYCEGLRRYSDFLKLRTLLSKSPLVACVKGIDFPDKHSISSILSKLPFNLDPNILERKKGLEQYLRTVATPQLVCTSDIFQEFLKSAVLAKRIQSGTLPQEKITRKKSQRIAHRGRSKEMERGSDLGPIKSVYSSLADYLDTAAPLPCQQLNTLQATPSRHLAGTRDQGASKQSSERREGLGDTMLHPAIALDKEEFSELDNPSAQISPVGSVGSVSILDGIQGAELPDHTPSHDRLCYEEEEGLASGSRGTEVVYAPRGPDVSSGGAVAPRGPEVSSGDLGRTPLVESFETTPFMRDSELSTTQPATSTDGCVPEVPVAAPPSGVWPERGGWQGSVRRYLHNVWSGLLAFLHILLLGARPFTHERVKKLTEELKTRLPFSNGLLSLATEAARLECPETCALGEAPQLGVLCVVGGVMDRFLWKMLHKVVYCEDTWARALYSLRNKLWPRGVFLREDRPQLSEEQRKEQVNMAVKSLKKFLPDALPYIVGSESYDGSLRHCLECLQNKRINKHFILRVMDHLMIQVFPELMDEDFQRHLKRLRSTAGPGRKTASAARL